MKNSDEMINDLFERRTQYAAKQKQKKKILVYTSTSFCCFCLVALLGFGVWNNKTSGISKSDGRTYPAVEYTSQADNKTNHENPAENNKIIINRVESFSGDGSRKSNISLNSEDYIEMDDAALVNYYGTNIFPGVPNDLKKWEDGNGGIYKRNSGKGEVYYDGTILNYSNKDFSRTLNIEISKASMPITDCAFFSEIKDKSIINNTEIAIGDAGDGYYYAQFAFCNVTFRIIGEGLSENEFINIVSSLTK